MVVTNSFKSKEVAGIRQVLKSLNTDSSVVPFFKILFIFI